MKAAENIRQEIENLEYVTSKNQSVKFTISIGVTTLDSQDINLESLLHRADIALYNAKHTGRNKVVLFQEEFINR